MIIIVFLVYVCSIAYSIFVGPVGDLFFSIHGALNSFSSSFSFHIYFFERLSLVMNILSKGYKKLLKILFIMCLFATFHPQFCCKSCSHVLVHVHGHLITVAQKNDLESSIANANLFSHYSPSFLLLTVSMSTLAVYSCQQMGPRFELSTCQKGNLD